MKFKLLGISILLSALAAIYCEIIGSDFYGYLKALTTVLIILLPILFSDKEDKQYRNPIITGLVFCLCGDVILLNPKMFIYGLIAFLIAHLIFCYTFYRHNKKRLSMILLIPFALIGVTYYWFLLPNLGNIAIPVAVYISVIVLMSWLAADWYFSDKGSKHLAVFIGAVLFLVSDSILAFNKFVTPFDYSGLLILSTYWLAISLFALSTVRENKKV